MRPLVCSLVLALAAAAPVRAGIDVALVASAAAIAPGDDVWVTIQVTQSGSLFNGYEAILAFDPAALAFVPEPGNQEGPYMLAACGTTFHAFSAGTDRLSVQHALLCMGTSLPGPGALYRVHFRATAASGTTVVSLHEVRFYNGGFPVTVASITNATIEIAGPTDAASLASAARLAAAPNPLRTRTRLLVATPAGGGRELAIYDARGRRVRRLVSGFLAPGERLVSWDGTDDAGAAVPSGAYWVRLSGIGPDARLRLLVVR